MPCHPPPPSIDRVAPYKSAGITCKSPNEGSSVKRLNGPDKSPNEEINNWVVVALLILIRRFHAAPIPAGTRSFFTASATSGGFPSFLLQKNDEILSQKDHKQTRRGSDSVLSFLSVVFQLLPLGGATENHL